MKKLQPDERKPNQEDEDISIHGRALLASQKLLKRTPPRLVHPPTNC